jgi:hypothetical protein
MKSGFKRIVVLYISYNSPKQSKYHESDPRKHATSISHYLPLFETATMENTWLRSLDGVAVWQVISTCDCQSQRLSWNHIPIRDGLQQQTLLVLVWNDDTEMRLRLQGDAANRKYIIRFLAPSSYYSSVVFFVFLSSVLNSSQVIDVVSFC